MTRSAPATSAVPADLAGLPPEEFSRRLAEAQAALDAAQAEAHARAEAQEARWQAAVEAWRRRIVDGYADREKDVDVEARAAEARMREAAADGDVVAGMRAWIEFRAARVRRGVDRREYNLARAALGIVDGPVRPELTWYTPTFWEDFQRLADEAAEVRGRAAHLDLVGDEPDLAEFAD
ncbi:hypothetical protein [Kineococcus arenarius]|uniref:hypothetical protein n=1 Tax=unclassified Kineococcus TaxID=2621656 RepID=UPI003D7C6184